MKCVTTFAFSSTMSGSPKTTSVGTCESANVNIEMASKEKKKDLIF